MPWTEQEQRARTSLFTISIAGDAAEHAVLGLSGLRRLTDVIEFTDSGRVDFISLAGHLNVENITVRDAPIAGCLGEVAGNFLFEVRIGGKTVAHTRRVSGLGVRWEVIENRESWNLGTQKLWDKRRYEEVTHDVVVDWQEKWQLYEYVKKLGEWRGPGKAFSVVEGFDCDYAQDVIIAALANDGSEIARWTLYRAWPSSWRPISDLAADSREVGISSVTWVVANLPGSPGIREEILRPRSPQGLVSEAFLTWVAKAYDVPERKDLIVNFYLPGLQPGKDAPVARIKLFNAWPSRVTYQDFDANANDPLTREIEITFDGLLPL
jgi:phage tail-like protein